MNNTELYREVSLRVNRLGDNEWRLAVSRAQNKNDVNELAELVDQFRNPFMEGRVASIGSMVAASPETWTIIANESDAAAKRELLKSSAVLTELEELERKARLAQEEADRKSRELQAIWEEHNRIPQLIEAKEMLLAQLGNEIRSLDPQTLKDEFKQTYSAMLDGAMGSGSFLPHIAMRLYTSDLRLEVLTAKAEELDREVAELKSRAKTLAKRLGQRI